MEIINFFKYVGLTSLVLFLIFGVFYWLRVVFLRLSPEFKWWFKYNILRKKYDENVVAVIMEAIEKGVEPNKWYNDMLLMGKDIDNVREWKFIYNEILRKQAKGGVKYG